MVRSQAVIHCHWVGCLGVPGEFPVTIQDQLLLAVLKEYGESVLRIARLQRQRGLGVGVAL
jgi:hypothetical protein